MRSKFNFLYGDIWLMNKVQIYFEKKQFQNIGCIFAFFVVGTKIIYGCNFAASLKVHSKV